MVGGRRGGESPLTLNRSRRTRSPRPCLRGRPLRAPAPSAAALPTTDSWTRRLRWVRRDPELTQDRALPVTVAFGTRSRLIETGHLFGTGPLTRWRRQHNADRTPVRCRPVLGRRVVRRLRWRAHKPRSSEELGRASRVAVDTARAVAAQVLRGLVAVAGRAQLPSRNPNPP